MTFKLFGVFLPLICALQSPRFLSWSNENKEAHGRERRETAAFYLRLSHQPCFFTYLPFFLSSPFLGKVNLFTQSQRGDLDTPTQLRSLSTHPCQGELSLRKYTHACTHTHDFSMFCIGGGGRAQATHTRTNTHIQTHSEATSPRRRSAPAPHLCVQKANSLALGSSKHAQILIIFIIF